MTYREPLPENCPPDAAEEIAADRLLFRLQASTFRNASFAAFQWTPSGAVSKRPQNFLILKNVVFA
jgi:hypothetical protein